MTASFASMPRDPSSVSIGTIVDAIPDELPSDQRFIIAISGPPAAGKSTLAQALRAELGEVAAVLQMDAFHFDNPVLIERGHRPRKGAPHTFDVAAYRLYLSAVRDQPELQISVPLFDRALELSRNCAEVITPAHRIIITEGNYLLLNDEPWASLGPLFDLTVSVTAPIAVIEARILERWSVHGLTESEAVERAESNDLPNARYVIEQSRPAQITITTASGPEPS